MSDFTVTVLAWIIAFVSLVSNMVMGGNTMLLLEALWVCIWVTAWIIVGGYYSLKLLAWLEMK